jgi:hypothetical protein
MSSSTDDDTTALLLISPSRPSACVACVTDVKVRVQSLTAVAARVQIEQTVVNPQPEPAAMIYRSRVPLSGLAVSQAADGKVFEKAVQFPTGSGSRQVLEAPGRFHKCATLTTTYGSPTSFVWLGDVDAGACVTVLCRVTSRVAFQLRH